MVACCRVWSETRVAFPGDDEFLLAMQALEVSFSPPTEEAATFAGAVHKRYRAAGGKRDRVIAIS